MPGRTLGGSPGNHRPRLLPREVGGGSSRDRRHPGGNREDAHVLRAQETFGAPQRARNRSRLAMNAKQEAPEREEIEALLPWHAAGTLSRRDAQRVEDALARDPELARRYALVREELGETIHLNETLGAPSARALENLFAKIDAEPERTHKTSLGFGAWLTNFVAGFQPRTLAYGASAAALAIVLQAGILAGVFVKEGGVGYTTVSLPQVQDGAFVSVRFNPQASAEE